MLAFTILSMACSAVEDTGNGSGKADEGVAGDPSSTPAMLSCTLTIFSSTFDSSGFIENAAKHFDPVISQVTTASDGSVRAESSMTVSAGELAAAIVGSGDLVAKLEAADVSIRGDYRSQPDGSRLLTSEVLVVWELGEQAARGLTLDHHLTRAQLDLERSGEAHAFDVTCTAE
jgi:hypothetical protein